MNNDVNNLDKVNDEFQDNWLNDNLKLIQMEPTQDFTKKVIEQIDLKPNPLNNSPIFWILAVIPGVFIVWLILFALNTINQNYQFNLDFLPNISTLISLSTLSKYVLMIIVGGLFFIGLDYFLNQRFSHRESFFSFVLV